MHRKAYIHITLKKKKIITNKQKAEDTQVRRKSQAFPHLSDDSYKATSPAVAQRGGLSVGQPHASALIKGIQQPFAEDEDSLQIDPPPL